MERANVTHISRLHIPWNVQLLVDNKEVSFTFDTGAEVTAITEQSYQSTGSPCLQKPQKQLRGSNKHSLDVIDTFPTTVSYKNKSCSTDIYVVCNLAHNLLGLPMITELYLIVIVDTIQSDSYNRSSLHILLHGLGTLQNEYDNTIEAIYQTICPVYHQTCANSTMCQSTGRVRV